MPPRSDYVLRHGGRYDRDLVHFVEQWASSGVMVFKQAEAEALWECALEGDKITERERDTLKCVVQTPTHISIRSVIPEARSAKPWKTSIHDDGFQKRKGAQASVCMGGGAQSTSARTETPKLVLRELTTPWRSRRWK
jgi:hypothetical protein